jgi:hypothetical protein
MRHILLAYPDTTPFSSSVRFGPELLAGDFVALLFEHGGDAVFAD